MAEQVVLVDERDREIGSQEKLRAHVVPQLHRAVSVFVCNSRGEMLVQQRASQKYHSASRWSNACCGHPRPGETARDAANRRLRQEMGVDCQLHSACVLTYRLDVGDGLFEHELNHVFVGLLDGTPRPDPDEVAAWKWLDASSLRQLRTSKPSVLTPWFEVVLSALLHASETQTVSLPSAIAGALRSWG